MDQDTEKAMFDTADKFIELANEMTRSQSHGAIGVALRYAAARYSAFEASLRSENLAADKDRQLRFFADTFTEMLDRNFDDYIRIQEKNRAG